MSASQEELENVRKRFQEKKGSYKRDVTEWRPPSKGDLPKDGSAKVYRFRFLPPLKEGDEAMDGDKPVKVKAGMDWWCLENGNHWINNRPNPCPRIQESEAECPVCQIAFDMFDKVKDKKKRGEIARAYLPRKFWAVNVYFINDRQNPEELRGKVMWLNLNRTLYEKCEACVMNDDPGDDADPKPHGLFYAVDGNGYVFQLEVRLKDGYANYDESRFLVRTKGPLAVKDKKIDQDRVNEIMSKRQLLSAKLGEPDMEALKKAAARLVTHDDDTEPEVQGDVEKTAVPQGTTERPKPAVKSETAAPVEETVEESPVDSGQVDESIDESVDESVEPPKAKPKAAAATKPKVAPKDPELDSLLDELERGAQDQ